MRMYAGSIFMFLTILVGPLDLSARSNDARRTHRIERVSLVNKYIAENPNLVLVFSRPGCPFCQYVAPIIKKLESNFANVRFITIDITNDPYGLKNTFSFNTVPTIVYYKNGKEVTRHGSKNKQITYDEMAGHVQRHLS